MTVDQLAVLGAQVVALAALLMAVVYVFRVMRQAFRWIERVHEVTTKELTHNHGSSMKDDTHGMAVAIGDLQRRVDDIEDRFGAHLRESLAAQRETAANTRKGGHRTW